MANVLAGISSANYRAGLAAGLAGIISCLSGAPVAAKDWPQWGGSSCRNMASDEVGLPEGFFPGKQERSHLGYDLATAKNVKWLARLGSRTFSSPVVAQGRVLIGTNDDQLDDSRFEPTRGGVLNCFDEASGELLWRLVVPRLEGSRHLVSRDFEELNLGICATPCVDEDRVYVVTNRCEVVCLDLQGLANGNCGPFVAEARFSVPAAAQPLALTERDADIVWRYDMLHALRIFPHDACSCSVLVHGDYLYVGTGNGVETGIVVRPEVPSLIVLDKHTGELVARDDTFLSPNTFHGQWSSPSLAKVNDQNLLFYGGGDGFCYAFSPLPQGTGMAKRAGSAWKQSPLSLPEVWYCDANPAEYRTLDGEEIDYWKVANAGRRNHRLQQTGPLLAPCEIIGTPVCYNDRVYVAIGQDPMHGSGAGALSCIDATGSGDVSQSGLLWRYTEIGRSMSTVSIADGLLYIAETAGKIHCLEAETGRLVWDFDLRDEVWSSTMVADGKIYVGTRRGLAVMAAGREPRLLFESRLGSPVRSVPAVANGTIYIATQKNLWAITKQEMPADEVTKD
jgi:outer membrane protein assembly factor BamB